MNLLDLTPSGARRMAARAIDDNRLYTERDVWAWWRLPAVHLDYLTIGQQEQAARTAMIGWAGLAGYDLHIVTMNVPTDPHAWAADAAAAVWKPQDGWAELVGRTVDHLERRGDTVKRVYVGIRLGDRRTPPLGRNLGGVWGAFQRAAGGHDHVVPAGELAAWAKTADHVGRPLDASPATADEVARLVAHSVRRAPRADLPVGTRRWGPGELAWLAEGTLHRQEHSRYVRYVDPDGRETFHTTLAVARFPPVMEWPPGPPWACLHEWLPDQVELSARWQVVGHREASKDVRDRLAAARDQKRHAEEAGVALSERDYLAVDSALALEAQIDIAKMAIVRAWTRYVVTADSPDGLATLVGEVKELFRDADIILTDPAAEQSRLLLEAMPGDRVRVNAYRNVLEPEAAGIALPNASSQLGDGRGPYLGRTTGPLAEQPVHFDPLAAVRDLNQQRPPVTAIVGAPGGGKTVDIMAIVRAAVETGARVVVVDPKGDAARLAALGPGKVDVVDLTTDAPDGVFDPWRLTADTRKAKLVAIEIIDRLVQGRAEPRHRMAIDQAVQAESEAARPSLSGVVDRLTGGTVDGREIASTLRLYMDMPLARLMFAPPSGTMQLDAPVTIITSPGVEYPTARTPIVDMTGQEKLAVTATYATATYARHVALHDDPETPKLIVIDEAWTITATGPGRALIDEVARMGRSRRTAMVIATQFAADFASDTVLGCVSQVLAHKIEGSAAASEGKAVAALLGVSESAQLTADLQSLQTGELVMRDLAGHVGTVAVDVKWDPVLAAMLDHNRQDRPREVAA